MKIHKILNNNFVIIKDSSGQEMIVGGKGIAYSKKIGDNVDESSINKTFTIPMNGDEKEIEKYLAEIPIEYFKLSSQIVELAKLKLNKKLNDSVVLSIADHISTAINRYNEGIEIPNFMLWEIKKFYAPEFEIGLQAINLIEQHFGVRLSEDEAGNIATHIIDAELEHSNIKQIYTTATIIKDISNIVKYYFNVDFDTDSIYYYRFITHLKFFANRILNEVHIPDDEQDDLYLMIKKSYPVSFDCSLKINEYVLSNYNYPLSSKEIIYLTIHIENIVYKINK